jgi:hypothetical protein
LKNLVFQINNDFEYNQKGSTGTKLNTEFVYKAEYKSRLDGQRRYVDKENACFVKFEEGEEIVSLLTRAVQAQKRTVRSVKSEATAKQQIMNEKIISEAEDLFGKENSFLADACKESLAKVLIEEQLNNEEETKESVSEEITVIKQNDENRINIKRYQKKVKKKRLSLYSEFVFQIYGR